MLNSQYLLDPLTAEICWRVWGIPANFIGFRLLSGKAKCHYAVHLASRPQTSSRPNSITLSSLRTARELVAEQHSVMKYGLNRTATRFELSRHVRNENNASGERPPSLSVWLISSSEGRCLAFNGFIDLSRCHYGVQMAVDVRQNDVVW